MDYWTKMEVQLLLVVVVIIFGFLPPTNATPVQKGKEEAAKPEQTMSIGPCKWIISRQCPDDDVKFYLFTRQNMMDRQRIYIDKTLEKSNISQSFFNPDHPTKIIIHGYNSNMFLDMLFEMKDEYLQKGEYNIIYVDWSVLGPGPCYFSAAQNTKHGGACTAQLVERILDMGSGDVHVIGFSLGAQLANYIARNLGFFLLPRITGLDPALPLFITSSTDDKLDATDAEFVDVIHTNAFVQGKLERCGHLDFYMNGGIYQPGCSGNIFACSHQRAPAYFLESIRSTKGFWGWACSSYISYLLGFCPPTNYLVEAGENANPMYNGFFLITTSNSTPFALGKWTDLPDRTKNTYTLSQKPVTRHSPLLKEVDEWGKLEGNFNNIMNFPTPYSQDPNGETWPYFGRSGTKEITQELKEPISDSSTVRTINKNNRQNLRTKNRHKENKVTNDDDGGVWPSYRRNLTMGFIDKSVFQVPKLNSS
ncbi:pancreatic triacylglycerol lipase-like [Episyrphus balteatus]|uniref:pancreatic triacylglycerol lipase-like n=1 Tax=Episyrphus balteatus TaxID=286459 RepID=UPI0024869806|nr:pancreatic triacylglycerol lipase-like [Episyrphus balteatus]